MQIGEPITAPGVFVGDDVHNEHICPWHTGGSADSEPMDATDPDEDTEQMPPNDGGKLGRSLRADGEDPPATDTLSITYERGEVLKWQQGKKPKEVQIYEEADDDEEYELQYAPHHLIPGNESLKGSGVVPFLGDDNAITNFTGEGQSSHIKQGHSVLYDVNDAGNGVWLPSPYALSNANSWPAAPAIRVIKKRRGANLARMTEDFKTAYVAASIEAAGDRQFHMRHKPYSDKVREVLETIAERLCQMADAACPIASGSVADGKVDPPGGLKGRLHVLSANLRMLLIGGVWRDPMFTDELTATYARGLDVNVADVDVDKVV